MSKIFLPVFHVMVYMRRHNTDFAYQKFMKVIHFNECFAIGSSTKKYSETQSMLPKPKTAVSPQVCSCDVLATLRLKT